MKDSSIHVEGYVYTSDNKLCGRADLYTDEGEIWEVKTKTTGADVAATQLGKYLDSGNKIGKSGPTTSAGTAGRFSDSFFLSCGKDWYEITYYTPQAGVVLYSTDKCSSRAKVPYAVYVPQREASLGKSRIGWGQPNAALGDVCILLACLGGGGYCFDFFRTFGAEVKAT